MPTFVVLGMHRSGTSCVAGTLHTSGLHMGDDLTGPWFANLKGGFEDKDWVRLDARILADNKGNWYNPPQVVRGDYRREVGALVTSKGMVRSTWGFKDPHACLTIHLIHPHLPDPHYIMVTRHVDSVVNSLVVRNKFTRANSLALAGHYWKVLGEFLAQIDPKKVLWVSYERLVETRDTAALSVFCGMEIRPDFVDAELWHERPGGM